MRFGQAPLYAAFIVGLFEVAMIHFARASQETAAENATRLRALRVRTSPPLLFAIGVVYAPCFAVPGFFAYDQDVAPIQSQIGPNLGSCASFPAYYAEVKNGGDISAALKQIFNNFTHTRHLTN